MSSASQHSSKTSGILSSHQAHRRLRLVLLYLLLLPCTSGTRNEMTKEGLRHVEQDPKPLRQPALACSLSTRCQLWGICARVLLTSTISSDGKFVEHEGRDRCLRCSLFSNVRDHDETALRSFSPSSQSNNNDKTADPLL